MAQKGRYDAFLEKDEKVVSENYQGVFIKRKDGSFCYRQFFPEKMLLTDVVNYSDKDRTVPYGPVRRWYDNGHRTMEAVYVDGQLEGQFREYDYTTDSLIALGQYAKGIREGEWLSYYDSGRLRKRERYANGLREGEFTIYDTLGVVTEQGVMRADTVSSYVVGQKPGSDLIEKMPQFPGCEEIADEADRKACADRKLLEFIYGNVRYPERAVVKDVQGKALVGFVIEKDGRVNNIEVRHGLNLDISKEVQRIISIMPDWHPGYRLGEPVRVQFNLPVTFKLQ